MKTRGLATPKLSSDYIYDDPNSISNPSPTSSMLRPLVKCPSCPKSFSLLRSFYGHFGSSHAKYGGIKLNHDKILFGCPYCEIDEVEFMTLKGVESHVENYHEDCKLLSEVSTSTSNIAATNSETEVSLDDVKEQSLTRRLISHPLGKCPRCPKILSLRGVFGHFGRVHSGIKFDWAQVTYLCPFCNEERTNKGNEVTFYDTFEETRAHVESYHEGCVLVQIGPSRKSSQSENSVSSPEVSLDAVRSSQRKRNSVSIAKKANTASIIQSTQMIYQCPSCERTFNKQGLATHYGIVHSKTLNWDEVKVVEYEGRAYICPECDRTFSKTGLSTHYGMMHDGKLDWSVVKIADGDEGISKRKIETTNIFKGEGDESQARKSRRISARANLSRDGSEYDFAPDYGLSPPNSSENAGLNYGPWTTEEHEAFLIGHKNYGNEWKRISVEFVPTRTAKQIGSHALAYFTTKGVWEGRNGTSKKTGEEERYEHQLEEKEVLPKPKMFDKPKTKTTERTKLTKAKKKKSSAVEVSTEDSQVKRFMWTDKEHAAFLEGHKRLGNSWLRISQLYVPSKTPKQVGSHALHHFTSIGKWEDAKRAKRHSSHEGLHDTDESLSDQSDDGNFDYCVKCELGGILICCSDCPRSFHQSCISNDTIVLPVNWSCERCQTDLVVLPEEELPLNVSSADVKSTYSNLIESEDFEVCSKHLAKISSIVSRLKDLDHGYIFAEPVDISIVPHYTEKISIPMDYSTIMKKIQSGEYMSALKLPMKRPMESVLLHAIHDIELVHKNCAIFNPKGSSVYRAGSSQSKKWTAFFNKYLREILSDRVLKAYRKGILDTEDTLQQGQKRRQQSIPRSPKQLDIITATSGVVLTREQFQAIENIYFTGASDLIEPVCASKENTRVQISQWFEKLEDLRKYKLLRGTAVVTTTQDEKLYQWIIRQRKRFHLTLHHKPELQSERYKHSVSSEDKNEDIAWLIKRPKLKGTFALSPPKTKQKKSEPPTLKEDDIEAIAIDLKSSKAIQSMHQQTLYYPLNSSPPYRHSSSLFWDESLEELRFFHGEHNHTLIPRSFTHNENLSLWVEIQRARLLLHLVGFDAGLLGAQMNVLDDELCICDMSSSPLASYSAVSYQNSKAKEEDADELDDVLDEIGDNIYELTPSSPPLQTVDNVTKESPMEVKLPLSNLPETTTKKKQILVPLCKCTACEKSFHTLRKLYGHFGSAHARIMGMKINTNDVLFGCPWCQDGVFKPLTEIQCHVRAFHPNCELSKSEYSSTSVAKNISRTKIKSPPTAPAPTKKRSIFKRHLSEFTVWYQQHPHPTHDTMSKELYSWCWKQLNGASALLLGTPSVGSTKLSMNVTKLKLLAASGFFRIFSYTDKGIVCEDDYEGSEEWDAAYNSLHVFSLSHGSTHIPDYFQHISGTTRAWVTDVYNELRRFIKGEHCELSVHQIEQLILIGFCLDRSDLPNMTRSDVIWFKRFRELKQYQLLIGDCHVTEDFPQLFQWLNEQKYLFRLFRMGNEAMMKIERLRLLMDAGVDFFTVEYFPYLTNQDLIKFEMQIAAPLDLFHGIDNVITSSYKFDDDLNEDDYPARFECMKATNGHSLVLADENLDIYHWFISMRSALLDSYAARYDADEGHSLFQHLVLSFVKDKEGLEPNGKTSSFKTKESLIMWAKYCERFMMFLVVRGHSHIPEDYPDVALSQWLSKQANEIYLHCNKRPKSQLPLHLKILMSLGVKGKKRHSDSILSSRTLRRKGPNKSKLKKADC